jgi:hypothetical protein
MKMRGAGWVGVVLLLTVTLGLFWYWEGENFSDRAVSGTYTFRLNGETSTLVLRPDHSFQQELDSAGTVRRAEGSWHVFGEGGIAFSEEFLKVPGEEMGASGRPYGQIENWFGIVSITLAPNPDGPRFHKKLFR